MLFSDIVYIFIVHQTDLYRENILPAILKIKGNEEIIQVMEVKKEDIFHHAMSRYKRMIRNMRDKGKVLHVNPVINFTEIDKELYEFDGGGIRRQYYSIFFQECLKRFFEGSERNKLPKHGNRHEDTFVGLGIAIVESILNEDCGFPYLNKTVFMEILSKDNEEIDMSLDIHDIPVGPVLDIVKKVY